MFVTYTLNHLDRYCVTIRVRCSSPPPVPCRWSVANSCKRACEECANCRTVDDWVGNQCLRVYLIGLGVQEWERGWQVRGLILFRCPVFYLLMSTNWSWTTEMNWFAVCTRSWFSCAVKWLVYDSMCRGASWEQDFSSSLYIVTIILFMGGNPMYYVEVRSGPKTKNKNKNKSWKVRKVSE